MRLAHIHLPKPIPYSHSLRLQEALLEKHFAYNSHVLQSTKQTSIDATAGPPQPRPTLLTFQTQPVYTVGRRHLKSNPLSQAQIEFLTTNSTSPTTLGSSNRTRLATFYPSPRGGLLTYHAPGQLTAYLIVNLRTHNITPRCFIRLLENTVIRTCAQHGVPNTLTTEDPGVWIGEKISDVRENIEGTGISCGGDANLKATTRKICAIGVHVTRGVTSHGIGLNVLDSAIESSQVSNSYILPSHNGESSRLAPGYLSWGFSRITACGLEGKSVTWLTKEGAEAHVTPNIVAETLAEEVCKSLTLQGRFEITGVDRVTESEVLSGASNAAIDQVD